MSATKDAIRVYTASQTKHGQMWRDWRVSVDPAAVQVVSTWIDESGAGETADFSDLWRRCVGEATTADLVIGYHAPGDRWKGALVEIGAALAWGRPVYLIGEPEGSWVAHPLVFPADSPMDAVVQYRGLARGSDVQAEVLRLRAQRDRAWAALERVQSFGGDSAFGYGLHGNFELAPDAELWPMAALAYAAGQQVAAVLAEARAEKRDG